MSAGTVEPVSSAADWLLGFHHDEPSSLLVADSGIDDPVNDTGSGPRRGDLQLSDEFECLVRIVCEAGGEF